MWSLSLILKLTLVVFGILKFLRWLVRRNWKTVDKSNEIIVNGKTVLITGANTGIGKVTALELADRGAHVILACRDEERANDAVKWIRQKTTMGKLTCMKLDLSSLHSIRQFCKDFKNQHSQIDILINNAGVMTPEGDKGLKTLDGFEIHMGVNHLGHFLLTNLLLDLVKKAVPSRIVTVSSMAHSWGKLDLDDLMSEKKQREIIPLAPATYSNSKLANALFNKELAKRLEGTGVNCYALCPGIVETELGRNVKGVPFYFLQLISPILRYIALKTPEEGAQTTIYCALNKDLSNQSGQMYQHCGYWDPKSRIPLMDVDARKLWTESERLVGLN